MHTDLSPHLHTDECNQIIQALFDCRKENSWRRLNPFRCDHLYTAMLKCTKKERIARRDRNYANAKVQQAAAREKVANDTTDYEELIKLFSRQKSQSKP